MRKFVLLTTLSTIALFTLMFTVPDPENGESEKTGNAKGLTEAQISAGSLTVE